MATVSLEARVSALEEELARLKGQIERTASASTPWWEKIKGVFANDPASREAIRLGAEYRDSLRPKPRKARGKAHARSRLRSR